MPKIDRAAERERMNRIFDEIAGVISELDRCTGLAKEQDNHHFYKVFADYVRKHLEKL